MAKAAPNNTIDTLIDYVNASNVMHVCSAEPANYAGIAAVSLASVAMTSGDFTKADASGGGRQSTVAAKSGVSITATGNATHVVLASTADSTLRYVTTSTLQALTSGNTVNVPSWVFSVGDPA